PRRTASVSAVSGSSSATRTRSAIGHLVGGEKRGRRAWVRDRLLLPGGGCTLPAGSRATNGMTGTGNGKRAGAAVSTFFRAAGSRYGACGPGVTDRARLGPFGRSHRSGGPAAL